MLLAAFSLCCHVNTNSAQALGKVVSDAASVSMHNVSHRSVLSTKADEAEPLKPGKVWDEHSVLLLEGGEPLADKLVSELQQEVKKVRCARPDLPLCPPVITVLQVCWARCR